MCWWGVEFKHIALKAVFLTPCMDCALSLASWLLSDPKGRDLTWQRDPWEERGEEEEGWPRGSQADAGVIKATWECDECDQSVKASLRSQYTPSNIYCDACRDFSRDKMERERGTICCLPIPNITTSSASPHLPPSVSNMLNNCPPSIVFSVPPPLLVLYLLSCFSPSFTPPFSSSESGGRLNTLNQEV